LLEVKPNAVDNLLGIRRSTSLSWSYPERRSTSPASKAEIMKFQIGSMSVGDILDRGLKLLLARLPAFYAINLIVLSPIIAYQLLLPLLLMSAENQAVAMLAAVLGGSLVVLFLALILQPIGTAAILHIISQEFIDRRVGIGAAFRFALSRFGPLLGASIVAGLLIGLGMICCLVPGFIFWTWYAFVPQVVVVEGRGVSSSLDRSKQLGEGYRWRIFGILILILLLSLVIPSMLDAGLGLALPASETVPVAGGGFRIVTHYRNQVIHTIVTNLVNILFSAYLAVCLTLLYFDLRIRKEGYDLEMAAASQQTALPADLPEPQVDVPEA
jgi:hypothetical protein